MRLILALALMVLIAAPALAEQPKGFAEFHGGRR
jgi:hypothetical protein